MSISAAELEGIRRAFIVLAREGLLAADPQDLQRARWFTENTKIPADSLRKADAQDVGRVDTAGKHPRYSKAACLAKWPHLWFHPKTGKPPK